MAANRTHLEPAERKEKFTGNHIVERAGADDKLLRGTLLFAKVRAAFICKSCSYRLKSNQNSTETLLPL